MNALLGLLVWFISLFNPTAAVDIPKDGLHANQDDLSGVHIINVNPRTVVALEDTHFRPNR